ncbi:MAG: hypothetical protein KGI49_02360 [Patescibacteria group bacterium]|nr:hypothetical protein [Patescibacteria group bacterium]
MNMQHKQGVFEEKCEEYWKADKKRKSAILSSLVEVTRLTRKACIKRLRKMQLTDPAHRESRGRPRYYTPDVIAALLEVWEIGSEACGENLHPMINEYVNSQIAAGSWKYDDVATGKLRKMSLGSVKDYVGRFTRTRRNFGGKSTTEKSSVISMVPIRMDGWDTAEVGVIQVDTVAHCGDTVAGDYVMTVNGADVATLWGTRRAQWCKGQVVTKMSLEAMRKDSPFPWTEIHPDSGSEFINLFCISYAKETYLRMTRSRPYHKNDNCFVEERNGHVIRAYVGYGRLDMRDIVDALNELYDVLTPYLNHFIANRRIVSKQRIGAKWKITREKTAKTPYRRVLERTDVSDEVKEKLHKEHATLNPAEMKKAIDRLGKRVHDIQSKYGKPKKSPKNS